MDSLTLDQSLEPKIMSTAALLESAALARDPKNDIEAITQKLLLKNLLTLPSSSTTALLAISATPPNTTATSSNVTTTTESMITKEINDAQLNLTKILYEPDEKLDTEIKEKDHGLTSSNDHSSTLVVDSQINDDDDRLVIDISDDEKKDKRKRKKEKKMTPLLEDRITKFDSNQLPTSITYSLETTSTTGVSSSVKIDILASNLTQQTETASIGNMTKSPTKNSNISVADELNLLGHEIDRQMGRKTNEILELIKAYLSNTFSKTEFHERMNEVGSVTMSDLSLITRKTIKRHKFEPNPNQHYFSKMKFLVFPTSGKDLVNYFESLLPSLSKEKFINMIKFYEIIIKEMLNLNRTKILQYLIDFMIKKKNSQLDLLNFNYLASTGVTIKNVGARSAQAQPDSTQQQQQQQPPSEKKPLKFFDTSYNFLVRSDPIYIMACSKFHTIIRNVIRCRCSSCVQVNSFERRPFDNNILRNRRIGKRLVNERDDLREMQAIPEKFRRTNEMKMINFPPIQITKIQNSSPILVSDTPPPSENSSPPALQAPISSQADKPRILQQFFIQRAFSERHQNPLVERKIPSPLNDLPKFDFPKITSETSPIETPISIKQHPKRRPSVKAFDFQGVNQVPVTGEAMDSHITINELKTLTDNGTEIIPTSVMRNTITTRRKTVDERAQIVKTSSTAVEVKKIPPAPPVSESTAESAHRTLMKRRQSCHESILASSAAQKANEANLGQNYLTFLKTHFENSKREEEEMKYRQMQQQLQIQKQHQHHYMQEALKQARFESNAPQNSQSLRPNHVQYAQAQPQGPMQHHQLMQRAPAFYEQQHQKFVQERLIRERYFDQVETLQERDPGQSPQQPLMSPKSARLAQERLSRMPQRTPTMSDEKMLIAYQQLQSLRDSSTIGIQQYTEQLKNLHQYKPTYLQTNIPRQNSPRESFYQNTQHQQGVPTTTVPPLSFFYPPTATTTTVTTSNSYPITSTDQSLQKKLKLKSKTVSNYVEPNSANTKPFYNAPNSTYYSNPYEPSHKKTPPTPTSLTAFHPLQQQSQQPQQPQVVERRTEMHLSPQQMQNYWLQQHHQQQNSQPNIARPIPISRVQGSSAFIDPKTQNSFQALQQHEQHSEFYRQYYHQQHHNPKSY